MSNDKKQPETEVSKELELRLALAYKGVAYLTSAVQACQGYYQKLINLEVDIEHLFQKIKMTKDPVAKKSMLIQINNSMDQKADMHLTITSFVRDLEDAMNINALAERFSKQDVKLKEMWEEFNKKYPPAKDGNKK